MITMESLLVEAEHKNLWLHCAYQDLWFSPEQLRRHQAEGRFRWGPVNWRLRQPHERLQQAEARLRAAQQQVDRIKGELHG
mgnify:CR=1 FL=1